jgi:spore germination protein GerM
MELLCAGQAKRLPRRIAVAVVSTALLLAACGTGQVTTTTAGTTTSLPPETTTTTEPAPTAMAVYFLLDQLEGQEPPGPFLVPVYRQAEGDASAMTAMELLLAGPNADEMSGIPAISTAIPQGTELLGVETDNGLATVNLSTEYDDGGGSFGMFARLAQVVYSLTRLDEVDEVAFEVEGQPVTVFSSEGIELDGPQQRDDYYDLLPPIFVDYPAWGEPVTSPVEVSGLSNVFEAVSQIMLTDDDGAPLFEDTVMASCGTGCWGEWSIEIPYQIDRDQFGALIVWEFSAQDGSRIHIREYPVQLR